MVWHWNGGQGGGWWDNKGEVVGGGVGDYLRPLYAQIWVQERRRQPGTTWCCAGGCIFPASNLSSSGASLVMMTSTKGGGQGDTYKTYWPLLSFSGSDMSCHLCHVNSNRLEAMEVLIALLYDRVDWGFSRPDMSRIFIALGDDARVGGGGGPIQY